MGSICSSPDENQIDRSPSEAPLILWGDIANSETRVIMTLLSIAKVRYEFQQVNTPEADPTEDDLGKSATQLQKEDYLEVPEDPSRLSKRITGRSIYVGERDSFFKYITQNHTSIEA